MLWTTAGIQGWGKVDALVRALLNTTGLSVSSSSAEDIIRLYNELDEFDKRPVTFQPRPQRQPRGRFARSKANSMAYLILTCTEGCERRR